MTQREWYRELIAWKVREEARVNRDARHAYLVAYLTRVKDAPPLNHFLVGEQKAPERQTVAQMKTSLQLIAEYYGLKLRKGKAHYHG